VNAIDQQVLFERLRFLNRRDITPEEFFSFMVEILEVYFDYWLVRFSRWKR
jgi:hypothetical protein